MRFVYQNRKVSKSILQGMWYRRNRRKQSEIEVKTFTLERCRGLNDSVSQSIPRMNLLYFFIFSQVVVGKWFCSIFDQNFRSTKPINPLENQKLFPCKLQSNGSPSFSLLLFFAANIPRLNSAYLIDMNTCCTSLKLCCAFLFFSFSGWFVISFALDEEMEA